MVDKKLSEFSEVGVGDVSYFPVLDGNTKNAKIAGTKAMPWTNCLTEIPQDITLELNNGTLTLKAGSKVYVPNGSGVFNVVTITNDITATNANNGKKLVFGGTTGTSALLINTETVCVSGTTDSLAGTTYHTWYDTTNNLVKYYAGSGTTVNSNRSLPIALITVSGGQITSIDQVFNGFGYIGSTVFALPGVSGLIPNGRNEDGTLKNITFSLSSVKTGSRNLTGSNVPVWLRDNGSITFSAGVYYDEKTNLIANTTGKYLQFATTDMTSGVISNFTSKSAFHAADYSDVAIKNGDNTYTGTNNFSGAVTAPTPAVSNSAANVATTQWFNDKIKVVSTLPASPDSNVYYFVTG